jgi:prolyl oligopeptidase
MQFDRNSLVPIGALLKRILTLWVGTGIAMVFCNNLAAQTDNDPYRWLEEVTGEPQLAWVRERNAQARSRLEKWPDFAATRDRLRQILDAKDRLPQVSRHGDFLYNFWRDEAHPRGVWRRTTLAEFAKVHPEWELLIDLDALALREQENWVWGGSKCLGGEETRCILSLSRGGADAKVMREFDLNDKAFVQGGFALTEAKSTIEWEDLNTVLVGTDFGTDSMTASGYPRVIKRWRRGQALAAAQTVFEGRPTDVSVWVSVDRTPGFERTVFGRSLDFWTNEIWRFAGDRLVPIAKPADAQLEFWYNHVLLLLRSDFVHDGQTWPSGSLIVSDAQAYLRGAARFSALFTPTSNRSLQGYHLTRSTVLLDVLQDVAARVEEQQWRPAAAAVPEFGTAAAPSASHRSDWVRREVRAPLLGSIRLQPLHDSLVKNDQLAEHYFLSYADFLTPDSSFLGRTGTDQRDLLRARSTHFDASGMKVQQRFATSQDGTRVPYFVVWPKGAVANGLNPTLLYGYGGFRVSLGPWYSAGYGAGWLASGGVLVIANIRGGGEYGPQWHQAALKAHKQTSYDDFIAVAQDLVAQGITNPSRLGIAGGSNGGLLVGAVMVQRPELFGAVLCQVPLLDMKRYHKLLAGASWMAEYGDPDNAQDWASISRYSPYQNVQSTRKQPAVFFTTSTRDDRVHPGHARKMAARMIAQSHDVVYFENIEGGHGGAANNAQRADLQALEFAFLWQQLSGRVAERLIANQPPSVVK